MQWLFNYINIPLGYVMRFIAGIFDGNFAVSVLLFTLFINLLIIPLTIKSQKSTVQQTRIKPKLDELKKRYGDDKQKYNTAMQQLYQEEGVSMSGGCLPMLVRMLLLLSIYYLIMSPLTYMAGADHDKVTNVNTAISTRMSELSKSEVEADKKLYNSLNKEYGLTSNTRSNNELGVIRIIRDEDDKLIEKILTKEQYDKIKDDYLAIKAKDDQTQINYKLFGIDLTRTPKFSIDFKTFEALWFIPIGAFLSQILTSVISMKINKKNNPDAPSMAGMMLLFPIITLFIGFGLPGGVGFYWICSSLIGGLLQSAVQVFYGPQRLLAATRAKELAVEADYEIKQLEKFKGVEQ